MKKLYALLFTLALAIPSAQATLTSSEIQQSYVAYLGRPADLVSLVHWLQIEEANSSSIANALASTLEYNSRYGGLTSDQIVSQIYQTVFSHAPDPNDLIFWSQALSNGMVTQAQLARLITDSAISEGNMDGDIFLNKVAAASAFTAALNTVAEVQGYAGVTAFNLARAWISTITDDVSLSAALQPDALNATVANVTALPPTVTTLAAGSITATSATLTGTVRPNGLRWPILNTD